MTVPTAPLVFIVDDDPSVRKSLARLVRAAGFDVKAFASAREFLARPVLRQKRVRLTWRLFRILVEGEVSAGAVIVSARPTAALKCAFESSARSPPRH